MAKADPFEAVRNFEKELAAYTGAPRVVAVNSCCAAILLACLYSRRLAGQPLTFEIPRLTYVGAAASIANAGCNIVFRDEDWQGHYELKLMPPYKSDANYDGMPAIFDAARRFRANMFNESVRYETELEACVLGRGGISTRRFVARRTGPRIDCLSFHISKILGHSQGGCLVHNLGPEADDLFRRMRFDGRREGVCPRDDTFDVLGQHCYMSVDVAAALRWKLSTLSDHNEDLPRSDYSDLSLAPIFGGPGG